MSTPAVQRDATEKAARALYALLDLSKALSSEIDVAKLLDVIVEKASAVVEAERTRIVLYDDTAADINRNLINTGAILSAPVFDSHGKILGVIESSNKMTRTGFDAHDE